MASAIPTVHVLGEAGREVVPDEVVVTVVIDTPPLPTPAEALALGVERRRRVRDALSGGAPDAAVRDARVTTRACHEQVEEPDARGRLVTRTRVAGHQGECVMRVRAAAGRAVALMALLGPHPDVTRAQPHFEVGRDLDRATRRALEQEAVRDALARAASLAEAAGLRAGAVVSIGRPPQWVAHPLGDASYVAHAAVEGPSYDIEDELGELVPEPVALSATVDVVVELVPPA